MKGEEVMNSLVSLAVRDGALVEVPVYTTHRRARNWAAIVRPDPRSPGGLARRFLARAHGDYYYLIDGLELGQVIEFGADYFSSRGVRHPERWYGVVVSISQDQVVFLPAKTKAEAFELAKEFCEQLQSRAEAGRNIRYLELAGGEQR